ncbi:CPX chromosomal region candidate gene 1 protein [Tupaia chinensis]|uniref:CPX chromosomal region candidate gene 1 protein n=1 Tax=Tupaia chinensis TaxID=246437 RepID=UPI0003C8F1D0|nr:CPX chromosomal region candidate gene 1 protein [Tupaia chinensis]
MTSPMKEGSDPTNDNLKNSVNEAPDGCETDIEPLCADPDVISQVQTNPINQEPGTSLSQGDAVMQTAENNELEGEKNKKEDSEEEGLLVQIPIPRKWISLMSGLGRITYVNVPLAIDKKNPLTDSSRFYSGNMEIRTGDFYPSAINYKTRLQLLVSWRIPYLNNHDVRRMTLRLLCGRYFSQSAGHQRITWVKQKYIAFLSDSDILNHRERTIMLGRPLRVYYNLPLTERMTSTTFQKSFNNKGKEGFHVFVRPMFYVPQTPIQNVLNRKAFEEHLRSRYNRRFVIINTYNGGKYMCSVCGCTLNSLTEFRLHSCSFPEED